MKTYTTTARPADSGPRKSAAPKGKPWGARVLAPVGWICKSISWLISSEATGGAKFVLQLAALYGFALSAETVYLAMPPSQSPINAGVETIRFLPKPGIDDGAALGRLMPPVVNTGKRLLNNTVARVVPFYPKHQINPRWSIWADPNWYLAFGSAALIGLIEAKVLRRAADSWDAKKDKFQKYNNREVPDLNPKAVMAASLARAELQTEGTGNYAMVALVISGTYALEIYCLFRAFYALDAGAMATLVYGLYSVFGFEVFWALSEGDE